MDYYVDKMRCENLMVAELKKLNKTHKEKTEKFVEDYSKFIESYMNTLLGEEEGKRAEEHMIRRLRGMCL